jgi:hypothetical protein
MCPGKYRLVDVLIDMGVYNIYNTAKRRCSPGRNDLLTKEKAIRMRARKAVKRKRLAEARLSELHLYAIKMLERP